jgi:hypothetical protein
VRKLPVLVLTSVEIEMRGEDTGRTVRSITVDDDLESSSINVRVILLCVLMALTEAEMF